MDADRILDARDPAMVTLIEAIWERFQPRARALLVEGADRPVADEVDWSFLLTLPPETRQNNAGLRAGYTVQRWRQGGIRQAGQMLLCDPCGWCGEMATSWCDRCQHEGSYTALCMGCDREWDGCRTHRQGRQRRDQPRRPDPNAPPPSNDMEFYALDLENGGRGPGHTARCSCVRCSTLRRAAGREKVEAPEADPEEG